MNSNGLRITSRKLPHWFIEGATFFIKFRIFKNDLLSVNEQEIVLNHIKEGGQKYYILISAVVMPDHVHILIQLNKQYNLSRILMGIKGVSARKINRGRNSSGRIWQDESFDRIIRDDKELMEKLNYMHNNPVKKGLTDKPEIYFGWYINDKYNIVQ
ncbi:transposase [candidate division KSB1 bacterium]